MEIRAGNAKAYGYSNGFLVEARGYGEKYFAVPPWEEMGYPELAGHFPTKEAAEKAIARM